MSKINKFYNLLNQINEIIFILDSCGYICWINNIAIKNFESLDMLNRSFKDTFFIKKQVKAGDKIKDELGRRYKIKYVEELDIADTKKIIILESLEDYSRESIKIRCLEEIIQKIDTGVILSDYEGKVVLYNSVQEKLENNRSEDIVGKYLWNIYEYGVGGESEHRRVYNTRKPILNNYRYLYCKNGKKANLCYSTYPIELDGQVIGVFSISKNEKLLQELLQETIELRRALHTKTNKSKEENLEETMFKENGTRYKFQNIVGGEKITKLIKEAQQMALHDSNILIIGETGTGKEVFAQSIHNYSKSKNDPFIPINCAAIPENLLESILFGTVKGAYTGAMDTPGLFEEAKSGTIFLDELNSMPKAMQTKLLRVLQERRVRRIGGSKVYSIKCRVISAMNENPKDLIRDNRLRMDLFYRISNFTINIPSLRERIEDIDVFATYFIDKYNLKLNKNVKYLSKGLREILHNYNWPGNVREFEYVIENIMIRCDDGVNEIDENNIPQHFIKELGLKKYELDVSKDEKYSLTDILKNKEKRIILDTLNKNNWNVSKSSKELGIIRQSLIYRMGKLGIEKNI